jgi:hypothetical protein
MVLTVSVSYVFAQVVITGLTKQKLGDTFAGLKNVTLATSNGLVYSWGQNLLPAKHYKRSQLQHLASAAAAAAQAASSTATPAKQALSASLAGTALPVSSLIACEENSKFLSSRSEARAFSVTARLTLSVDDAAVRTRTPVERREKELGEVTQDLIALSLADSQRDWAYYQGQGSSAIDWQAVSNIARTSPGPSTLCSTSY